MWFSGETVVKFIVLAGLGFLLADYTRKNGFSNSRKYGRHGRYYYDFSDDSRNFSKLLFYIVWFGILFVNIYIALEIKLTIGFSVGTMICVIPALISDIRNAKEYKNSDNDIDNFYDDF